MKNKYSILFSKEAQLNFDLFLTCVEVLIVSSIYVEFVISASIKSMETQKIEFHFKRDPNYIFNCILTCTELLIFSIVDTAHLY